MLQAEALCGVHGAYKKAEGMLLLSAVWLAAGFQRYRNI
jgi:hypothetical protein